MNGMAEENQAGDGARSYNNFGRAAGPLTPPTLPFGFGRDAFERPAFSPSPPSPPFFPFGPSNGARAPAARTPARSRSPYFRPPRAEFVNPATAPPRSMASRSGGMFVPRGQPYPQVRSPFMQQRPPAMIPSATRPPPVRSPPPSQKQQSPPAFTPNKRLSAEFTRSPPPSSAEEQQREDEARARRLERFKHAPPPEEPPEAKIEMKKPKPAITSSMDLEDDWMSSEPVLGTCPDMCPESERGERERKGDLDRYERLDGDRNQTSVNLAVKKYTRTPERDPVLIRPLPVLRTTMDYLLGLLNKAYGDEGLLRLYNFLWDRMRAVRMDLRMQHIFNLEAVAMHEQMIRLHVLVMHELCEFPKGEGFVEGFDAHLNIEQMNKAFSELFQMYDDHRRNGEPLATEPEFRGYYTLLKLDEHLGFAVEPSDLSVELASMKPAMRSSGDVKFACEVARAYRLPNYVGFFRLAGKATYLQACLMHAQFPKVRIQALASLHSGLRMSQGIPLSHVTTWLGMEIQEVEELLLFHGFSIKPFEEAYAVRESEFLNKDQISPPSRSSLVESKRAPKIIDDIVAPNRTAARISWVPEYTRSSSLRSDSMPKVPEVAQEPGPDIVEEEMPDYEEPELFPPVMEPSYVEHSIFIPRKPEVVQPEFFPVFRPSEPQVRVEVVTTPVILVAPEVPVVEAVEEPAVQERTKRPRDDSEEQELMEHLPKRQETKNFGELATVEAMNAKKQEELARIQEEQRKLDEVIAGRERLWFRRWKLRTDAKVEAARVRRMEARAALLAMNSGMPVSKTELFTGSKNPELDLKHLKSQRLSSLEDMWIYLDVASVVAPVLKRRNPLSGMRTISWKLVFYAGERGTKLADAGKWLRSKLVGASTSAPEQDTCISVSSVEGLEFYCITREVGSGESFGESLHGASALVFLVDEEFDFSSPRSRLHSLVDALPGGTRVPLLIFIDFNKNPPTDQELIRLLELYRLDPETISSFMISPVTGESSRAFFCSKNLRKGVEWLASSTQTLPEPHAVDLRDLVWEKLEQGLKSSELATPDDFILVFNKSLQAAAGEISSSARSFPSRWPAPELATLPEEELELPFTGWNDEGNLRLILQALEFCRLLPFQGICGTSSSSPKLIGISPGVSSEFLLRSVRAQYKALRDRLERYLSSLGDDPFESRHSAEMLLDRAASLEWSERGCRVLISWSRVFQSIFRSRLMSLNSEPPPTVYITRKPARREPDETRSYEERLQFAACIRSSGVGVVGDEVPERIREDIVSFVASYNREYEEEEGERMREKMRLVREELKEVESAKKMKAPVMEFGDEVELPVTDAERELEMLVSRVNARLEKNSELELMAEDDDDVDLRVDISEWNGDRLHEVEDRAARLEAGDFHLELSSGDGGDKLSQLLDQCHRAQLAVDEKLSLYFGIT